MLKDKTAVIMVNFYKILLSTSFIAYWNKSEPSYHVATKPTLMFYIT